MPTKNPAGRKARPATKPAKKPAPPADDFGDPKELARATIAGVAPPGAAYTITRRKVPAGAFPAPPLTGEEVAALRAELGMSQNPFAHFLGVSVQTLQAWEQNRNPVPGIALRFLAEVRADVHYWKAKVAAATGG